MRADDYLLWFVRIAMVFALIIGIGLLIGQVRQSFLKTHNTETHIVIQEAMSLVIKEHKNTLGREYPVIVKTDFNQGALHRLNTDLSIGIKLELFNSSGNLTAGPIYLNQDYYDTYEPISDVAEIDTKEVQFSVIIEDAESHQIGTLKAKGVFRAQ